MASIPCPVTYLSCYAPGRWPGTPRTPGTTWGRRPIIPWNLFLWFLASTGVLIFESLVVRLVESFLFDGLPSSFKLRLSHGLVVLSCSSTLFL